MRGDGGICLVLMHEMERQGEYNKPFHLVIVDQMLYAIHTNKPRTRQSKTSARASLKMPRRSYHYSGVIN